MKIPRFPSRFRIVFIWEIASVAKFRCTQFPYGSESVFADSETLTERSTTEILSSEIENRETKTEIHLRAGGIYLAKTVLYGQRRSRTASSGPAFPASSHVPRKNEIALLCFMNGDSSRRSCCQLPGYSELLSVRSFASVAKDFSRGTAVALRAWLNRSFIFLCERDKICYHQQLNLSSAYSTIPFPTLSWFIFIFHSCLSLACVIYIDITNAN